MGYSNPEYQARPLLSMGRLTGTATASGTNAATAGDIGFAPPQFVRKTKVNALRIENVIATPANWTGLKLVMKNGTDTVGTMTGLGTGTAQQVFAPTLTSTLGTFGSGSGPTFVLDGTSTASGQSFGTFNIFAEVQELPA